MISKKGRVLVTGGAGYIGSHAVLYFKEHDWDVAVVDNFSKGNRDLAQRLGVPIFEGDIGDIDLMRSCFTSYAPDLVMHFSAFAYVGESVLDPQIYYRNNLESTIKLLHVMLEQGIKKFIFSSTCATYGVPDKVPMDESTHQNPINPYGRSKLFVEKILQDYDLAYGLKSIIFRYFNAAGAHPSALIGERHKPETHLIPVAIHSAARQIEMSIFGDDYPTSDGTCVRDYIHILDIADAHMRGADLLLEGGESDIFNIGNGSGYSVLEVLREVELVTGKKVPYKILERRAGDPPSLVAEAKKIRDKLGWVPQFPELREMVESAWRWYQEDWDNQ